MSALGGHCALLKSIAAVVQRVSIKSILDGLSVLELRSLNEVIEEINLKAYIILYCVSRIDKKMLFHLLKNCQHPSCRGAYYAIIIEL